MTRLCDQCGKHLVTHRSDARFCDEICKARWHNERRAESDGTAKRIDGQSGGAGSHGGNVRSVQEARKLQEQQKGKARWTLIVREHIRETLVKTGGFHADDVQPLGVPEQHSAVIGSQIASFVNRKLMQKVGERKCLHKAANGRKAAIYRITPKGRREMSSGVSTGSRASSVRDGAASADPGVQTARVDSANGEGKAALDSKLGGTLDRPAPPSVGDSSGAPSSRAVDPGGSSSAVTSHVAGEPARPLPEPEPLSLLPEPDPEAWAA